ncbi:hypothetical protein PoB_003739500 [Plakobranchus ocellatus]|uniref:Uncharacterized protein n=1 Tax=Plakobranchus ocellatus TaxID=259542 RepID=A0AAV4AVH4_9GAST|nr:hypothetical protein PoB_003739500 [Plakobranchus ocellatus]
MHNQGKMWLSAKPRLVCELSPFLGTLFWPVVPTHPISAVLRSPVYSSNPTKEARALLAFTMDPLLITYSHQPRGVIEASGVARLEWGAEGRVRTCDSKVPADVTVGSPSPAPPTPPLLIECIAWGLVA